MVKGGEGGGKSGGVGWGAGGCTFPGPGPQKGREPQRVILLGFRATSSDLERFRAISSEFEWIRVGSSTFEWL